MSERQAGLRLLTAALRRQGVRERAETHIGGVRANPFSSADAALRRVAPASSADLRIAPAVRLASPARRPGLRLPEQGQPSAAARKPAAPETQFTSFVGLYKIRPYLCNLLSG